MPELKQFWQRKGGKMERIIHAAILRIDKCIVFDRDHARCILRSPKGTCKEYCVKGFLTSECRFVNRYAAARLAFIAGQIPKWEFGQGIVSEELWSPSGGGKHIYDETVGYVLKEDEERR